MIWYTKQGVQFGTLSKVCNGLSFFPSMIQKRMAKRTPLVHIDLSSFDDHNPSPLLPLYSRKAQGPTLRSIAPLSPHGVFFLVFGVLFLKCTTQKGGTLPTPSLLIRIQNRNRSFSFLLPQFLLLLRFTTLFHA